MDTSIAPAMTFGLTQLAEQGVVLGGGLRGTNHLSLRAGYSPNSEPQFESRHLSQLKSLMFLSWILAQLQGLRDGEAECNIA